MALIKAQSRFVGYLFILHVTGSARSEDGDARREREKERGKRVTAIEERQRTAVEWTGAGSSMNGQDSQV